MLESGEGWNSGFTDTFRDEKISPEFLLIRMNCLLHAPDKKKKTKIHSSQERKRKNMSRFVTPVSRPEE